MTRCENRPRLQHWPGSKNVKLWRGAAVGLASMFMDAKRTRNSSQPIRLPMERVRRTAVSACLWKRLAASMLSPLGSAQYSATRQKFTNRYELSPRVIYWLGGLKGGRRL